MAALQLVSSFLLQNSVTGPKKKLEKAIDLAYTTLMHVQFCSHAHLIMWLAHCILCKQQLILHLAYMYSVAVLIIPMQLARSYTSPRHQHLWCYFLLGMCFIKGFTVHLKNGSLYCCVIPRVHNTLQRVSNANYHCTNTLGKVT